jgi:hypothetical protein
VGEYYQMFLLTIARLEHGVILEAGELTADEFESYAALDTHLTTPGTITCQHLKPPQTLSATASPFIRCGPPCASIRHSELFPQARSTPQVRSA